MKFALDTLKDLSELCKTLLSDSSFLNNVDVCSEKIVNTLKQGCCIFTCGNGGSYTTAAHLSEELIGRFKKNRKALRSICLASDNSALTCIANDFGFDKIFSRELEGLGNPGDCLVVFSTSGNSPNITECLKKAGEMGLFTIGILGKDGGEAKELCDIPLIIPSVKSERIQEIHTWILHVMCDAVESVFSND